ncbi:imidazole glycerol phosphate synthase subunit HisF [Candidatus Kaiserbacteria bacterium]|nr:imidazole glycerol phosphate synthase subunit HisF [Candidatus Kaiserbacteria bacterium]
MLKTRVIPVLTIKNERLVKSVRFADHRNIGSYIAAVRVFNARDVDELIFLDLDAGERGIRPELLREVTKECFMPVTLGGGVRTVEDIQTLLNCGADKVSINTGALEHPELIDAGAKRYGSQCIVVSIDVEEDSAGAVAWAKEAEARGAGEILLTSKTHDGVMEGFDLPLIKAVSSAVRIPVIACGGAGSAAHCVEAVQQGASAVGAASIFQYTQTTPQMIKKALVAAGILARV